MAFFNLFFLFFNVRSVYRFCIHLKPSLRLLPGAQGPTGVIHRDHARLRVWLKCLVSAFWHRSWSSSLFASSSFSCRVEKKNVWKIICMFRLPESVNHHARTHGATLQFSLRGGGGSDCQNSCQGSSLSWGKGGWWVAGGMGEPQGRLGWD